MEQKISTEGEKAVLPVRHDWYQTESAVVVTVLVKNIKKENLDLVITQNKITIKIDHPDFKTYDLCLNLSNTIDPDQSSYKLSPTKIEIKLKKLEGIRWEKLEGPAANPEIKNIPKSPEKITEGPPSYPTSKKGKDWNKVEKEINEQESKEKPEGDEALNKLFQEIYGKGSDDVKKAMNKSFLESGGTVLSTNWSEIAKQKTEVKPPDGMEFKKWND